MAEEPRRGRDGSLRLPVVLGSSSKWRRAVVEDRLGLTVSRIVSPDIDEKAIRHDDPAELVRLLANAKADAVLPQVSEEALVITSDQVIVYEGQIREKPEDEAQCREFLHSYETHPAQAIVGVAVTNTKTGKRFSGVAKAVQHFKPIPEEAIDALIRQGDVLWCAGGFVCELMEDYLGALEGERETIIGLPKTLTMVLLLQADNADN